MRLAVRKTRPWCAWKRLSSSPIGSLLTRSLFTPTRSLTPTGSLFTNCKVLRAACTVFLLLHPHRRGVAGIINTESGRISDGFRASGVKRDEYKEWWVGCEG